MKRAVDERRHRTTAGELVEGDDVTGYLHRVTPGQVGKKDTERIVLVSCVQPPRVAHPSTNGVRLDDNTVWLHEAIGYDIPGDSDDATRTVTLPS